MDNRGRHINTTELPIERVLLNMSTFSHLIAPQSCKLIISTNFSFIFILNFIRHNSVFVLGCGPDILIYIL